MAFIDEISGKLGLAAGDSVCGYKVTLYGAAGVVAEGHKGIYYYSSETVKVRIKGGLIAVEGKNLVIKETKPDELVISGNVNCVRVEET